MAAILSQLRQLYTAGTRAGFLFAPGAPGYRRCLPDLHGVGGKSIGHCPPELSTLCADYHRRGHTMFNTLEVAVDGAIGSLWLNRPQRLNALSGEVLRELAGAALLLMSRTGCGGPLSAVAAGRFAPVPTSTGFRRSLMPGCARQRPGAADGRGHRGHAPRGHGRASRAGAWGGLVLAAACDLRVARRQRAPRYPRSTSAFPWPGAAYPRLVREIGPALTKELVITCREFSPQEAQAAGFSTAWSPTVSWMPWCRPWRRRWPPSPRCR